MTKLIEKFDYTTVRIPEEYQRDLNENRVEEIAKNLDWNKFGVPQVSHRTDDGFYYAVDGQHRVLAALAAGHRFGPVQVVTLSAEDEARLFSAINNNRARKALTGPEVFTAKIAYKDSQSLEIKRILSKYGLAVSNGRTEVDVRATGKLEKIVKLVGTEGLDNTLKFITESFVGDPNIKDGSFMHGAALFLKHYGDKLTAENRKNLDAYSIAKIKANSKARGTQSSTASSLIAAELRRITKIRKKASVFF